MLPVTLLKWRLLESQLTVSTHSLTDRPVVLMTANHCSVSKSPQFTEQHSRGRSQADFYSFSINSYSVHFLLPRGRSVEL